MSGQIITYRTEHFEFRVPIDDWNENKRPLQEGAVVRFIAPDDVVAILQKPFYHDWSYETGRRIQCSPTLVYGEEWVGREIRHFPYCKELLEFNEWLKENYGWFIPISWYPITESIAIQLMKEQGITRGNLLDSQLIAAVQKICGLVFSGYVWRGELEKVGKVSNFWSASEKSAEIAYHLDLSPGIDLGYVYVDPENQHSRDEAMSVRCVSY